MHYCFILQNSLTMLQKTINSELSIFDQVKQSVQSVIKNIFRTSSNNFTSSQSKDTIHLFITSSTQPISSYTNNNELHVIHQLRNLQCTIPTFPAQVIESALYDVGRFRCLNQSETFLGYRQGTIFEPAVIFYITDSSNPRQITKINQKILRKKFHLRAQYKFITIKYCPISQQESNPTNIQKLKSHFQTQPQTQMMQQVMKKVNGQLVCAYSSQDMINIMNNSIQKYNNAPTFTIGLTNKEYKIYNKQIVKLQFATPQQEQNYLQRLKNLKPSSTLTKSSDTSSSIDIFTDTIPLPSRTKIPLPHQITPSNFFFDEKNTSHKIRSSSTSSNPQNIMQTLRNNMWEYYVQ